LVVLAEAGAIESPVTTPASESTATATRTAPTRLRMALPFTCLP